MFISIFFLTFAPNIQTPSGSWKITCGVVLKNLSDYVTRVQYITDKSFRRTHRCLHVQKRGDPKRLPFLKSPMLKEDENRWFVMRIRHSSIARLQAMTELLGKEDDVDETYIPTKFLKINEKKMDFAPCLLNYIFVRSTFHKLVRVKSNQEKYEPLRFVMHPVSDEKYEHHYEPLFISDKSMNDYMRITKEENDKIMFLENMQFAGKASREVQVISGEFTGVVGRIKRIKGLRSVILPIGEEMAVAIIDVANSCLRYLSDEEVREIEEQEKNSRKV